MPILPQSAYSIQLPEMYPVRQIFDDTAVGNVEQAVSCEMNKSWISEMVKPGMRVALAVGSRGIADLEKIVRHVGAALLERGAKPFIVPAMGSHGGGEAAGQRQVLKNLNITERTVGMPIISGIEVAELGNTSGGVNICIDKAAYEADMIVPIARIKPHTDYKATIESGLCKMLVIGLGNHEGCSRLHQYGFGSFARLIPEAAQTIIKKARVGFGVAVVENAYDKTLLIETIKACEFLQREPELLDLAYRNMPSIMIRDIDVLLVNLIGKDISGAGMDPNIIGRTSVGVVEGFTGPKIKRIIVKGISPASQGNACGIGIADYVLRKGYAQIDFPKTYTNCISSGNPEAGKIPIIVEYEFEGIVSSLKTSVGVDYDAIKIVEIKSTLELDKVFVSAALLPEVRLNKKMELLQ